MSFTVVKKLTRPNTDTSWYEGSSEKADYMDTQDANGNRVERNMVISEDELIKTITVVWKDDVVFDAARDDSRVEASRAARESYNIANNIIVEKKVFPS